ncbi:MAG TPA: enoyl-CoA hydratase/isomerase family protein [Planctomycetota bacterium]|nr:enoyl-CoA hydratase/isomerase family protein [Planctomycetota bacterium]
MSLAVLRRGDTCEMRLSAPPGNVIDRALCADLLAAIREHGGDRHLKAFVLSAEGRHFSYGASVPDHVKGRMEEFLPAFHGVFHALAECSVPVVAAVRGLCLGGAFELASFASFVVAEKSASFAVPEITLGVFPPVACLTLPGKIGGARAEDMILTGRRMDAEEAKAAGLVNVLCGDGELEAAVERFLDGQIRPKSAAVLRLVTRLVREGILDRLPELERGYLRDLMQLRDANEGIAAFLEKRKPGWEDR